MIVRNCKNCKNPFVARYDGGKPQLCCSIKCRDKIWRDNNKDKLNAYNKVWVKDHPDVKNVKKKWREKNRLKMRIYDREWKRRWRKENPGLNAIKQAEWGKNNPEKIQEYRIRYRNKNRENINKLWNKRFKERYKNDPNFKIAKNLRNRMNKIFKGISKSSNTLELLGVKSVEEAKMHIEKQFKPGMTWNNYRFDVWHIDHIVPLSSFDLTIPENQKKAFNYKNLQPLWTKENLIKGKKILPLDKDKMQG